MCPPSAGATRLWEYANPQSASITDPDSAANTNIPDCVPRDKLSQAAYSYARKHLDPVILNHSLRVYLLAHGLASRESSRLVEDEKRHLFFAACILHDIGTTDAHNGDQRFEVESADAAAEILKAHHVPQAEIHDVWTAIAVHTSPGIAERISPLARLVRLGVAMDFKRPVALAVSVAEEIERVEGSHPRREIEKVLGDAVVRLVVAKCEEAEREGRDLTEVERVKAPPSTWPGGLVESAKENPEWGGVNKAF